MNIEFGILYAIQNMHNSFLDSTILYITDFIGGYGTFYLLASIVLMLIPKTRKMGITMISAYVMVLIVNQCGLKELIARPRPCHLDETVELLVKKPGSFSCPSTHTAWAFAAAASVYCYFKKPGTAAFIFAAFIAFTRMYLFVHFPTDVILGAVIGILSACLSFILLKHISSGLCRK